MRTKIGEQYEPSPLKPWSALRQRLAACGQAKATPQQWIGIIRNLQNKGVSAVEIEWSNVIPALEQSPELSLQLDELLACLAHYSPCELELQRNTTADLMLGLPR